MKNFRMAIVVLAALVLIALTEMGRTAVNRVADYKELTAPKSLHQLALEARPGESDGRGGTLLLGAGLAALALVFVGAVAVGGPAGREFGRAMGRRRRKTRARPSLPPGEAAPLPAMRVLPPAPRAPALPLLSVNAEEGRYEDLR